MAAAADPVAVDGSWVELFASTSVTAADFDKEDRIVVCGGQHESQRGVRYYKAEACTSEQLYDADFLKGPSQSFELVHMCANGFSPDNPAVMVGCGDEVHKLDPLTLAPKGMVMKAQLKI